MQSRPKFKICKRFGAGVHDKCSSPRFAASEARVSKFTASKRRRVSRSPYAVQFSAKQKIRLMYGMTERQFVNVVREAIKSKDSNKSGVLYGMLESRLDNCVYRLGLAPTRRAARQMIVHGHILVGGKRLSIPSYQVKKDDVVSVREASREKGFFVGNDTDASQKMRIPEWMVWDQKSMTANIKGIATADGAMESLDLGSVVEFYSR
jgi:small subunit ribosomal protein S4